MSLRRSRLASVADAPAAVAAITKAVAAGELSPDEAVELTRLIEGFVKVVEISDIERRLRALEATAK